LRRDRLGPGLLAASTIDPSMERPALDGKTEPQQPFPQTCRCVKSIRSSQNPQRKMNRTRALAINPPLRR
jgi:hypothetical protein